MTSLAFSTPPTIDSTESSTANMSTTTVSQTAAAPVELDSHPINAVELTRSHATTETTSAPSPTKHTTGGDETIDELTERSRDVERGAAGWQRAEERARQQAERVKDPAVLVNIPGQPAAEDYEAASKAGQVRV